MLELLHKIIHILLAVSFHEAAHGYAAYIEGDPTAKNAGRLTLNPIKHLDPVFSVLLPLLFVLSGSPVIFGGAKPVPINPYYFRRNKLSLFLVSAAGIMTNLILAFLNAVLMGIFPFLFDFFATGIWINIFLFVFNALPIPPLDGSRIFMLLLPQNFQAIYRKAENYGLLLVFLFIYFLGDLIFFIAKPIANIFFFLGSSI